MQQALPAVLFYRHFFFHAVEYGGEIAISFNKLRLKMFRIINEVRFWVPHIANSDNHFSELPDITVEIMPESAPVPRIPPMDVKND